MSKLCRQFHKCYLLREKLYWYVFDMCYKLINLSSKLLNDSVVYPFLKDLVISSAETSRERDNIFDIIQASGIKHQRFKHQAETGGFDRAMSAKI